MLKFDPQTILDWKARNIELISVEFTQAGCEGTSIWIRENVILNDFSNLDNEYWILIYCDSNKKEILNNAYITHTGVKWIMKSDDVLTRCGCGKSFGIKTGDSKIDKIKLLKAKLSKNKKAHHDM
jgi:hypothetical protein